ncbi:DUF4268 domain-containing protein [Cesiribacter andamanensis]|uniref:DUF4268 domain-containing protein n=1 Tax=Cesiribacter andamanensis AMV16 TaxID=1279009 RepID=M7N1R0_9BACT|nr:DUF4268 domain-containing protein [Cesiribacter andamanensis]EMR02623.1 hypothetical protein ADICEAN_02222 [Cesiribacter andamanensis AMV16]
MFSRDEAKAWNERFYTLFGTYMRRHQPQAEGARQWLNYRTGVKDIFFRIEAGGKGALAAIDIQHTDEGVRQLFWEQFEEFKKMLELQTGPLLWEPAYTLDSGRPIARLYQKLEGVSLYREDDWHQIFPFFEKYLLGFDAFWADFREAFIDLAE